MGENWIDSALPTRICQVQILSLAVNGSTDAHVSARTLLRSLPGCRQTEVIIELLFFREFVRECERKFTVFCS